MRLHRIGWLLLAVLLLLPQSVLADAYIFEPQVISESAILMEADSGQILYAKDMDKAMYPASITKILTGLLALKYGKMTDVLTLSDQVVRQVPRSSSHVGLLPGEEITLEDALYALAISSANDAAIAIAEYISGSVEAFADLMNREAAALGAVNSHFVNPNGMPAAEHYTTARDMALIAAAALKTPGFSAFFGATSYQIPKTNLSEARLLESKNKFIDGSMECPGLIFSKTGWTSSALGTLVTVAEGEDRTLIAVVLKSPMLEDKYTDTQVLYDYGFEGFQKIQLSQSLLETKLWELGVPENNVLAGYTPVSVLLPKSSKAEEVRLSVPGGFDANLGVSAIPVSVEVAGVRGTQLHITDLLLTIEEAALQPKTAAEQPRETSSRGIHPGVLILLSIPVALLVLWLLGRKKIYS